MDVRYAIAVLWPRTPILLLAAILAGAVAFVGSGFLPPTYESRARLLVGQASGIPPSVYEELLAAQILATTYAELGTATPVLESALATSRVDVPLQVFKDSVRVEPVRNSPLVEVICEYRSPEEAASMCNAMADEIAALGSGEGGQLRLVIIDPAEPGPSPVAPRPLTNGVVAGVGALALVGALILLFDRRPAGEP